MGFDNEIISVFSRMMGQDITQAHNLRPEQLIN